MWRLKDCRNVARFLGYADNPSTILMKFYPDGTLSQYLYVTCTLPLPLSQVLKFARGLLAAINAIHELGFIHCDIKPANILLESDTNGEYEAVLTDFGIAKMLPTRSVSVASFTPATVVAASMPYAAPEILQPSQFKIQNFESSTQRADFMTRGDVYAFGVVLYEMLTRTPPWNGIDHPQLIRRVLNGERPVLNSIESCLEFEALSSIVNSCWRQDPLQRASVADLNRSLHNL